MYRGNDPCNQKGESMTIATTQRERLDMDLRQAARAYLAEQEEDERLARHWADEAELAMAVLCGRGEEAGARRKT
jgi:hypothetical protein